MAELPFLPLKTDALLADTAHLTAEQFGAYLRLLATMWRHGARLRDDEGELSRISGLTLRRWRKISPPLMALMISAGGQLSQKRLTSTWMDVQERRRKKGTAGANGAAKKWEPVSDGSGLVAPSGQRPRSTRLAVAREKGRHTKEEWTALVKFCGSRCVKCHVGDEPIVKDHIVPIYQGGADSLENLQPLCTRCNSGKGADSTDFRPYGWQECLANAWQTPSNQNQNHKNLSSLREGVPVDTGYVPARQRPLPLPPVPLKQRGNR